MEFSTNKAKLFAAIAIILLMVSAIPLFVVPLQAQDLLPDEDLYHGTPATTDRPGVSGYPPPTDADIDWYFDVEPRLAFTPNPVGVNQIFTINLWVTPPPSAERFMKDYKVVITSPSGEENTVTIDSYVADGTAWFPYVADEVGEWTLQFVFIGMYHPPGWWNDGEWDGDTPGPLPQKPGWQWYDGNYYNPTFTEEQKLTVQEEFLYSWPQIDLPTDYWDRPINMEHREWAQIAGNYPWSMMQDPGLGEYNGAEDYYGPYITLPNTSHIVWTKLNDVGGIVGGEAEVFGDLAGGGTPDVIYMGRCYDTYNKPGVGNVAACFDLTDGTIYYEIPTSEGGVTPRWISYTKPADTAVPGAGARQPITATLISVDNDNNPEVLYKINPFTGAVSDYDLTNDEGDGPGRILAFRNDWFLSVRDSSDSVVDPYMLSHWENRTSIQDNGYPTYVVNWTVTPNTNNFQNRIIRNYTYRITPSYRGSATTPAAKWNWYGRFGTADLDSGYTAVVRRFLDNAVWGGMAVGININTGEIVWEKFFEIAPYSPRTTVQDDGVLVICFNQGIVRGYDVKTGNELWSTQNSYPFGGFWGYDEAAAYGNAYFWSYDGVQAFDLQTGQETWHYNDWAVPFETTYTGSTGQEAYSFNGGGIVGDGKVYTRNSEHTATAPYTRGWSLHCIDALTGEGIWKIAGPMDVGAGADGYLTATNDYNGIFYVFGKGKSETTVSAPNVEVPKGSAVMITGTVLDMSPAQTGTPCVSVDSMDTQMNYLHMQRPIDGLYNNETITGVEVVLVAIGSDGSYIDIGKTTTDGYYGTFGHKWTPPEEITYEIVASFEGSDAYGSSSAATYVTVGPAPTTDVPPDGEEPTHPMFSTEALITIGVIAIAAIAIIAYLIMRKPKQ